MNNINFNNMNTKIILAPEELREKIIEFYSNYHDEIESYKNRTITQLQKLVNAYLQENDLPLGSVNISARIKTIESTLKKIKYKGCPQFDFLPEIITDLIGTRIICWFLDDCFGIEKYIRQSASFKIIKIENYINEPKQSGYRAIHLTSTLLNEGFVYKLNTYEQPLLLPFHFEIQIKTKLQEAWGDISHEFYFKSKTKGIVNKKYESFLKNSAERLFNEDKTLNKFKIIWQTIKDDNHNGC